MLRDSSLFVVRRKNSGSRITPDSINKEATIEGRLRGGICDFRFTIYDLLLGLKVRGNLLLKKVGDE
jgi:hypothetical protein